MNRPALTVVLVGVAIAAVSAAPFVLAVACSDERCPEPVAEEGLLWVGGSFGLVAVAIGAFLAITGAAARRRERPP